MRFIDRTDAGKKLADVLAPYKGEDVVVYALPRGGVPVAKEIARELNAPLDLLIARKIGHPLSPEFAVAAVTENGPVVTDDATAGIDPVWLEVEVARQREEAKRRRTVYVQGHERQSSQGKIAIIVDDGLATGLTMKAAIEELKRDQPKKIIVAVPVSPSDTYAAIHELADDIICLTIVAGWFGGVGAYYTSFPQLTDEEVIWLMKN